MKEKIYTIPINEAYSLDSECPLCLIYEKLENEAIEYTLGAAMMEPDFRILSNEKGFCNRHFSMLFKNPNKLSLALVLDTHLAEIRKKFSKVKNAVLSENKKGFFKPGRSNSKENASSTVDDAVCSCVVCDKIDYTMSRYIDTLLKMWAEDTEFKKKFESSKGVCLPHYLKLTQRAYKVLGQKNGEEFIKTLTEIVDKRLSSIQEDIHKFTLKFDYRNKDMDWGNAKDAPLRTIEKLSGKI